MKKYVLAATALILIIVSFALPSEILRPSVSVGLGGGVNMEITTLEDLTDVLQYVSDRKDAGSALSADSHNTLALQTVSETSEEPEEPETEEGYTSITWQEDTSMVSRTYHRRYDLSNFGNIVTETVGYTEVHLTRRLICYMTGEASYYISRGEMTMEYKNYKDADQNTEEFVSFDMQIYISGEKVLFKFKEFTTSGLSVNKKAMGDRWVELPSDMAESLFQSMDSLNRDYLSMMGDYLRDKQFNRDGERYFCTDGLYEDEDTKLTVDLRTPDSPCLELSINGSADAGNMLLYDTICFSNIDNTVIDANMENVLVIQNERDLQKYFTVKGK